MSVSVSVFGHCTAVANANVIFVADTRLRTFGFKDEKKTWQGGLTCTNEYLSAGVEKIHFNETHPTMHRTTVPFRPIVQSRITRHNELNTFEVS